MVDYYPTISRAVAALPKKSEGARDAVYDCARTTLVDQLQKADPPLPEADVEREQLALANAISRVETEVRLREEQQSAAQEQTRRLFEFWGFIAFSALFIGMLLYWRHWLLLAGAIFFSTMTILSYLHIRNIWSAEQQARLFERVFGYILSPPIILVGIVIAGVALYFAFG